MIALLTLSLASAEQVNEPLILAVDRTEESDSRAALMEAAATCCVVTSAPVLLHTPDMVSGQSMLRFARGHTRRGMLDQFGGLPVSEAVLYSDFPQMIAAPLGPVYQRVGTTMHQPGAGLPPIRHPGAY